MNMPLMGSLVDLTQPWKEFMNLKRGGKITQFLWKEAEYKKRRNRV